MSAGVMYRMSCADCGAVTETWDGSPAWLLFFADHFRTTIEPVLAGFATGIKLDVHSYGFPVEDEL